MGDVEECSTLSHSDSGEETSDETSCYTDSYCDSVEYSEYCGSDGTYTNSTTYESTEYSNSGSITECEVESHTLSQQEECCGELSNNNYDGVSSYSSHEGWEYSGGGGGGGWENESNSVSSTENVVERHSLSQQDECGEQLLFGGGTEGVVGEGGQETSEEEDQGELLGVRQRNVFFGNEAIVLDFEVPHQGSGDIDAMLRNNRNHIIQVLSNEIRAMNNPPPQVRACAQMRLIISRMLEDGGEGDLNPNYFHLVIPSALIIHDEVERFVDGLINQATERLERHLNEVEGSGYSILNMDEFSITLIQTGHAGVLGQNSTNGKIKMRGSRQIYDPKGRDGYCLLQCLVAHLMLEKKKNQNSKSLDRKTQNIQRCKNYIRTGNIKFPIAWEDIVTIERQNNLSIYVYAITPLDPTTTTTDQHEADLRNVKREIYVARKGAADGKFVPLLLLNGDHFALIKNYSQFLCRFFRIKRSRAKETFNHIQNFVKIASADSTKMMKCKIIKVVAL